MSYFSCEDLEYLEMKAPILAYAWEMVADPRSELALDLGPFVEIVLERLRKIDKVHQKIPDLRLTIKYMIFAVEASNREFDYGIDVSKAEEKAFREIDSSEIPEQEKPCFSHRVQALLTAKELEALILEHNAIAVENEKMYEKSCQIRGVIGEFQNRLNYKHKMAERKIESFHPLKT